MLLGVFLERPSLVTIEPYLCPCVTPVKIAAPPAACRSPPGDHECRTMQLLLDRIGDKGPQAVCELQVSPLIFPPVIAHDLTL